jgi:hypothetical protein
MYNLHIVIVLFFSAPCVAELFICAKTCGLQICVSTKRVVRTDQTRQAGKLSPLKQSRAFHREPVMADSLDRSGSLRSDANDSCARDQDRLGIQRSDARPRATQRPPQDLQFCARALRPAARAQGPTGLRDSSHDATRFVRNEPFLARSSGRCSIRVSAIGALLALAGQGDPPLASPVSTSRYGTS